MEESLEKRLSELEEKDKTLRFKEQSLSIQLKNVQERDD